eukprot:TRINITY_DN7874_c0_g2_i1.p1 TRINITY_DN7874_c0_g2~~TRINITY_DN7874_c0_g2_i1.p1  ORF type:complete len:1447 (+),score=264.16 TRINITY_DN7874_c0_g2_i1:67-4407(+)
MPSWSFVAATVGIAYLAQGIIFDPMNASDLMQQTAEERSSGQVVRDTAFIGATLAMLKPNGDKSIKGDKDGILQDWRLVQRNAAKWLQDMDESARKVRDSKPPVVLIVQAVKGADVTIRRVRSNMEHLLGSRYGIFKWALFHYEKPELWETHDWYKGSPDIIRREMVPPGCEQGHMRRLSVKDVQGFDYVWLMDDDVDVTFLDWELYATVLSSSRPLVSQPAILSGRFTGRTSDVPGLSMVPASNGELLIMSETQSSEVVTPLISTKMWPAIRARILSKVTKCDADINMFWDLLAFLGRIFCDSSAITLLNAAPISHVDCQDMPNVGSCFSGCDADVNRPVSILEAELMQTVCQNIPDDWTQRYGCDVKTLNDCLVTVRNEAFTVKPKQLRLRIRAPSHPGDATSHSFAGTSLPTGPTSVAVPAQPGGSAGGIGQLPAVASHSNGTYGADQSITPKALQPMAAPDQFSGNTGSRQDVTPSVTNGVRQNDTDIVASISRELELFRGSQAWLPNGTTGGRQDDAELATAPFGAAKGVGAPSQTSGLSSQLPGNASQPIGSNGGRSDDSDSASAISRELEILRNIAEMISEVNGTNAGRQETPAQQGGAPSQPLGSASIPNGAGGAIGNGFGGSGDSIFAPVGSSGIFAPAGNSSGGSVSGVRPSVGGFGGGGGKAENIGDALDGVGGHGAVGGGGGISGGALSTGGVGGGNASGALGGRSFGGSGGGRAETVGGVGFGGGGGGKTENTGGAFDGVGVGAGVGGGGSGGGASKASGTGGGANGNGGGVFGMGGIGSGLAGSSGGSSNGSGVRGGGGFGGGGKAEGNASAGDGGGVAGGGVNGSGAFGAGDMGAGAVGAGGCNGGGALGGGGGDGGPGRGMADGREDDANLASTSLRGREATRGFQDQLPGSPQSDRSDGVRQDPANITGRLSGTKVAGSSTKDAREGSQFVGNASQPRGASGVRQDDGDYSESVQSDAESSRGSEINSQSNGANGVRRDIGASPQTVRPAPQFVGNASQADLDPATIARVLRSIQDLLPNASSQFNGHSSANISQSKGGNNVVDDDDPGISVKQELESIGGIQGLLRGGTSQSTSINNGRQNVMDTTTSISREQELTRGLHGMLPGTTSASTWSNGARRKLPEQSNTQMPARSPEVPSETRGAARQSSGSNSESDGPNGDRQDVRERSTTPMPSKGGGTSAQSGETASQSSGNAPLPGGANRLDPPSREAEIARGIQVLLPGTIAHFNGSNGGREDVVEQMKTAATVVEQLKSAIASRLGGVPVQPVGSASQSMGTTSQPKVGGGMRPDNSDSASSAQREADQNYRLQRPLPGSSQPNGSSMGRQDLIFPAASTPLDSETIRDLQDFLAGGAPQSNQTDSVRQVGTNQTETPIGVKGPGAPSPSSLVTSVNQNDDASFVASISRELSVVRGLQELLRKATASSGVRSQS